MRQYRWLGVGYEVDFLPVGEGGHGGDAIALRLGDLKNGGRTDQFVAIVDGGYTNNGHALVAHVKTHYGTDSVDVVVSTHLDRDHVRGLSVVLDELGVGQLWMHEPTAHEQEAVAAALSESHGDRKDELLAITASLQDSRSLADKARELGIQIVSPFTGCSAFGGDFEVIGPTEDYYNELVPQFREFRHSDSVLGMVAAALEAEGKLHETLEHETLEEGARTEPENNSSVITLIRADGRAIILTGDAGADGLDRAADHLDASGFDWATLKAMQIPHHGSRKNVTPSILNRYLGEPVQPAGGRQAYASVPKNGLPLYPARRVTNAFHRRGCKVYKTAGGTKRLYHDAPTREGFRPADEVPFYGQVD